MSKQYDHIQKIRNGFGLNDKNTSKNDKTRITLQGILKQLSEGLYSKNTHFLLELIQNAEDNEYIKEPKLSITLLRKDPTGTSHSDGAILIQNNETGFTYANMEALCECKTTKNKICGYIGEKGIGFKSVFVITTSPYIFSKGYQVRFPEKIEDIGLGYIIPEWVTEIPTIVDLSQTNIILPLNKTDKMDFYSISKMIREFTPETILFLNKLSTLNLSIEDEYNVEITKITNDNFLTTLICKGIDGKKEIAESDSYFLHSETVDRPIELEETERKDIKKSTVSLAFPVNKRINQCSLYAYLPVWENTGLPFVINADFLLTSSRSDVYGEKEWNIWLRDQIIDLFIAAIEKMVKIPAYRYFVLKYVPLHTDNNFLNPIIDPIISKLKDICIVATEPDDKLVQPNDAHTSDKFRNLLNREIYPKALLKNRLIRQEIQEQPLQEVGEKLGINELDRDTIIACFKDKEWIKQHNFEWILECYEYLQTIKFEKEILKECPIIPIKNNKGYRYSCDNEQPIYFECSPEDQKLLQECSKYIDQPIAFIYEDFLILIKEKDELKDWMTSFLGVHPFTLDNYVKHVLNWFSQDYNKISDDQCVLVTKFLIENISYNISLNDLPILLINGERKVLQEIKNEKEKQLVSPIGYDPETGWQNIFITEEDRQHLIILSDIYLKLPENDLEKVLNVIGATKYPLLRKEKITLDKINKHYYSDYTMNKAVFNQYELNAIKSAEKKSSLGSHDDIYIERKVCPSSMKEELNAFLCNSLVNWLEGLSKISYNNISPYLSSKVFYFKYSQKSEDFDSDLLIYLRKLPWLPTTKGYSIPKEAFVKTDEIQEIFGDLIPYINYNLSDSVLNLLKINTSITTDKLIYLLLYYSNQNAVEQRLIEKLYSLLYNKLQNFQQEDIEKFTRPLKENKSILVNSDEKIWASPNECIWLSREDLFGNVFYYIGKFYPKLKEFFLKYLGVKEDVDDEHYTTLWLKIQESATKQDKDIEKTMSQIMIHLNGYMKKHYEDKDNPVWLLDFKQKVLIYTENRRFEPPNEVFVPNDGKLKMVFNDTLDFTWIPEGKIYTDFGDLFRFLGVVTIKESVVINNIGTIKGIECPEPKYLTIATKKIIANWLIEKDEKNYWKLNKNGTIECLCKTVEYNANDIMLRYRVGSISKDYPSECFWDLDNKILFLTANVSKRNIADSLARELNNGTNFDELKNIVEAKLCYSDKDLYNMLEEDNKSISPEIETFFSSVIQISVPENAYLEEELNAQESLLIESISVRQKIPSEQTGSNQTCPVVNIAKQQETSIFKSMAVNKQEVTISEYDNKAKTSVEDKAIIADVESDKEVKINTIKTNEQSEFNLSEYIFNTFNSKDKPFDENANYTKPDKVYDADRRYAKEYDRIKFDIENENYLSESKRLIQAKIVEPINEQTKKSLQNWYGGKCQICGCDNNFIQRNGKPFFIIHFLIERYIDLSSDKPGNALCLCANHFAQMVNGRISADDIVEQFKQLNYDGKQEIKFNLCGKEVTLKFHKEHIISIQAFFNALNDH